MISCILKGKKSVHEGSGMSNGTIIKYWESDI